MKKQDKKRVKKGLCCRCGFTGPTQIHHIYGGVYRARSEKNDFVIELCSECHWKMHNTPEGLKLKKARQRKFEELYGHEEFMRLMGKSWL